MQAATGGSSVSQLSLFVGRTQFHNFENKVRKVQPCAVCAVSYSDPKCFI